MVAQWILIVLLIAAVGGHSASAPARIVGGQQTSIEKWPYVVQVESSSTGLSWSLECAGTIINTKFVVSAAHCFSGTFFSVSRRRLRAGSASLGSGGVIVAVRHVRNHPNFRASTKQADLAVVEQSAAWIWTPRIQSATLVPQDYQLQDDLPVILAGWGATRDGGVLIGQTSSTLREVTVETINREVCAERYMNMTSLEVDNNMLCTGTSEGGMDACSSDEGGPVFYQDANNRVFLVGIISWRHACGHPTLPSVNTRISSYTNWIVINALSNKP